MKFRHQFRLYEVNDHSRIYRSDDVFMRIDFIENMFRVSLYRNGDLLPTFSIDPAHTGLKNEGRDKLSLDGFRLCSPAVDEDEETVCFRHCDHDFRIELSNFRITISNEKGIL